MISSSVFIADFFGIGEILWGQIAFNSVAVTIPMFVVARPLQRCLLQGLALGTIKWVEDHFGGVVWVHAHVDLLPGSSDIR